MSKFSTLGTVRILTSKYAVIKRNIADNSRKMSLNDSGNILNDNGNHNLISQKDKFSEMSHWHLPPKYIEIFDSTNDIMKELQIKYLRLQEDQQRRIIPKFKDEENTQIDRQINQNIREMTFKIKQSEDNIKKIAYERVEDAQENKIKDNMKTNLASRLGEFTKKLKINEEEYMRKYKEIVGDDKNFISSVEPKMGIQKKGDFLIMDQANDILVKRDQEINTLVNSISELADIFKDLQTLVLEQGTILDRIDYNIENAKTNVVNANVSLNKTEEQMKSNCARNTNMLLLIIIFVCSILLIFKLF